MLWGPAEGSLETHEVADGLPGTAILGSMIICYCIWISSRFRELITTFVWGRGHSEVGGWVGGRARGQPPAYDEALNMGNLAPGDSRRVSVVGWALGSCGHFFSLKCWSRIELAQARPPRSSVMPRPFGEHLSPDLWVSSLSSLLSPIELSQA